MTPSVALPVALLSGVATGVATPKMRVTELPVWLVSQRPPVLSTAMALGLWRMPKP